eukprot:1181673-Prorocentrum_minimum.AAC.2
MQTTRTTTRPRGAGLPSCPARGPVPCRPPLPGSPSLLQQQQRRVLLLPTICKGDPHYTTRSGGGRRRRSLQDTPTNHMFVDE